MPRGNRLSQDDFVGAGFKRLDDHLIEQHPPMIKWGHLVEGMSQKERIRYLERLASAMNHAAAQLQAERDTLNQVCHQMNEKMKAGIATGTRADQMLQQVITRHNAEKQQLVAENTRLRQRLRDAGLE